jgi:hypothetical protein
VVAVAVALAGSVAWTRTAAGGAKVLDAVRPVASPPSSPSDTSTTVAATGLDPGLVAAFDAAVVAARRSGHRLTLTSGFRTVAEQEALLDDAVARYGPKEARRWVFPPDRSMHVRGLAVDVGDGSAAEWLDRHGAPFGLCRTLSWEWWHFEWRRAWEASSTCPGPVDDPADAPS